jgi:type IV pilus assembly protein PilE
MVRPQQGFTLVEILVTVVAVAILAAIALPQYGSYVTRGQLVEAHAGLGGYRVLMEQYYQDNRNYGTGTACGATGPSYKTFTHSCVVSNSGQNYVATATGNSGSRSAGFTFTIDHANTRTTTAVPDATWGTAPISCFVTKKGGQC